MVWAASEDLIVRELRPSGALEEPAPSLPRGWSSTRSHWPDLKRPSRRAACGSAPQDEEAEIIPPTELIHWRRASPAVLFLAPEGLGRRATSTRDR